MMYSVREEMRSRSTYARPADLVVGIPIRPPAISPGRSKSPLVGYLTADAA